MRIIIILVLLYLAYRALKIWLRKNLDLERHIQTRRTGEIDNMMVKDPVCNVYFHKKDAVTLDREGERLYFCSEECKNEYINKTG